MARIKKIKMIIKGWEEVRLRSLTRSFQIKNKKREKKEWRTPQKDTKQYINLNGAGLENGCANSVAISDAALVI